jgi:hypothetical protein
MRQKFMKIGDIIITTIAANRRTYGNMTTALVDPLPQTSTAM